MSQTRPNIRNSGRPPKAIITRELAAQAALDIIDSEGVEGLSLERVARKLGVRAPSLYYHLRNKAELLAETAKLILLEGEASIEPTPSGHWHDAVIAIAVATRRSILRHPRAASLMLNFFPRHLMLQAYERWLEIYEVPTADKMLVTEGIEKITFGSALFSATCIAQNVAPIPAFDAAQYPNLAEAIAANRRNDEAEFIEVLRRFLATF